MSLSLSVCKAVLCFSLAVALPGFSSAAATYAPQGSEYSVTGTMPGDQVHPHMAVNSSGGVMVWEDNRTDGLGKGVSALLLDSGLSSMFSPFRVNETAEGDQERPKVALLKGGGGVVVWQGGMYGSQRIYARFLSAANNWSTSELLVSPEAGENHTDAAVAVLAGGNVVVAWSSYNLAGTSTMRDIYAQLLSPAGEKLGSFFQVNQFTPFNQRNPAVTALADGGFAITWVSEQQRILDTQSPAPNVPVTGSAPPSVDVNARVYDAVGQPAGTEFLVNTDNLACSNPTIGPADQGRLVVAWSQKDILIRTNGWDIFARIVSTSGAGAPAMRINSFSYGDQFAPKLSSVGEDHLITWTSLAQDGSFEGVYGQFIKSSGVYSGEEFRVNTTTASKQFHPAVAADDQGRFLVAWTSFIGGVGSFDLFCQRYANAELPLWQMDAPFVSVPFSLNGQTYQPEIHVSWPEQTGTSIQGYKVYVDGSERVTVQENNWIMTSDQGLKANATHTFQVAFVATDGRQSPLSPAASATTWGGFHWGGIPAEWMSSYYGTDFAGWPAASRELTAGGPTLLQVFISGGSPLNPATWLRAALVPTEQGVYLEWNPQPGLLYQVQSSEDLTNWTDVGGKRFASGGKDTLFLGYGTTAYYRVVLMR